MRNALRAFLILALVPILIMSTDRAALAGNGPRADYQVEYDALQPGVTVSCTLAQYWSSPNGTGQTVEGSSSGCSLGWGTGNDWDLSITYTGTDMSGELCEGTWSGGEINIGAAFSWSTPVTYGCAVDEVCVIGNHDKSFADDKRFETCGAVAVGGPASVPEPPTECAQGSVKRPVVGPQYAHSGVYNNYRRDVAFTVTPKVHATPPGTWRAYVVLKDNPSVPGGPGEPHGNTYSGGYNIPANTTHWYGLAYVLADSGTMGLTVQTSYGFNGAASPLEGRPIVGYGIFRVPNDFTADGANSDPNGNSTQYFHWRLGRNEPGICAFYWGPKVVEVANTTTDDPAGPAAVPPPADGGTPTPPDMTTAPPTETANECSFSLRNPDTWLTAGMCAAVGLLGAMLGLLGEVLGAITGLVGALLDGIKGLFIPDGDLMQSRVDEVQAAYDDSGPGNYIGALQDIAPEASASGCAGPSFNLNLYKFNEDVQPFNACDGPAVQVAALVKLLLTCGLVVFGALSCIRGVGSGFGWQMSLGRGGDDA